MTINYERLVALFAAGTLVALAAFYAGWQTAQVVQKPISATPSDVLIGDLRARIKGDRAARQLQQSREVYTGTSSTW